MKKNVIIIIIVAVVALLLGGGIYLLKKAPASKTASSPTPTVAPVYEIYSADIADVKSVQVVSEKGTVTASKVNDDNWTVNNLPADDVDTSKAKSFASTVAKITSSTIISDDLSKKSEYGLDEPSVRIIISKNDGTTDEIYVGDKSPANGSYFAMKKGGDKIYSMSSYTVDNLTNGLSYFTDFTRFKIDDTSTISEVKFSKNGTSYDLYNNPDSSNAYSTWQLKAPMESDANSDYITNTMLKQIGNITLSTPLEGSNFGFDKPSATLAISTKDKDGNEKTDNFTIGKTDEGETYIQYNGKAYKTDSANLEFLNTSLLNLVTKLQALVDISKVEKVTIGYEGKTDVIDIAHNGDNTKDITFKANGNDADADGTKKMYQSLIGILADGIYSGQPTGDTILSIDYKGCDGGNDISVKVKTIDALNCAIEKDGKTSFTIKRSIIDDVIETVKKYIADPSAKTSDN